MANASCRPVGSVEVKVPTWLAHALEQSSREVKIKPELAGVCKKPYAVDDVESLAAPGRTIIRCCDDHSEAFTFGCMITRECVYLIARSDGWTKASTPSQLAQALLPIESPGQALGLTALLDQNHSLTNAQPHLEVLDARPDTRRLEVPGAEVRSDAKGYSVRLVSGPFCTCPRSVTVQTYKVSRAGFVAHRATETVADDGSRHCPE